MSKKSSLAKIHFILEMINNIEKIIIRHDGIKNTLDDYEGYMATTMGISQIGETIGKLEIKIIEKYNLETKGASATRNFIVHNYEGVSLEIIKEIVENFLPELKEKILIIISDLEQK
ncbi:MAG: HepT-like ribonuclease domain-containing protein [Alphaproteobacteria bacterium]|nr:MAG: hypothetical protein B6I23_01255 [Rickettsiaceae bacterium 4572_127]